MQNFSDLVREKLYKFGVEWTDVGKMCFFDGKLAISETVRDGAKVTISH